MSSLYFVLSVWSWKIRKLSSLLYKKIFERQNNIKCLDMFYSPFYKVCSNLFRVIAWDNYVRPWYLKCWNYYEQLILGTVSEEGQFYIFNHFYGFFPLGKLHSSRFIKSASIFLSPLREKKVSHLINQIVEPWLFAGSIQRKKMSSTLPHLSREKAERTKKPEDDISSQTFYVVPLLAACLSVCLSFGSPTYPFCSFFFSGHKERTREQSVPIE